MVDIGGVFAVDVSRDLGFCGHVYAIMTLDEDNNIAEPIDLIEEHQAVRETVILCEDGEINVSTYFVYSVLSLNLGIALTQTPLCKVSFIRTVNITIFHTIKKCIQYNPIGPFTHNVKKSKVPLTKTVTLTVRVNKPLILHDSISSKFTFSMLVSRNMVHMFSEVFTRVSDFFGVSDFILETSGQRIVENEDVKFTARVRVTCAKVDCQVNKNTENIKLEIR